MINVNQALYHSNIVAHTVNFDNFDELIKSGIGFVEISKNSQNDQRALITQAIQNIKISNVTFYYIYKRDSCSCLASAAMFQRKSHVENVH